MTLDSLVIKLCQSKEEKHVPILWQLLRFMADFVDTHESWVGATTDPLHLPIGVGAKRTRPVHPVIVQAVVRDAQSSQGRSSRMVAENLVRYRPGKPLVLQPKSASRWNDPTVGVEACSRWALMRSQVTSFYSVSLDATRLGGLDVLWLAVNLPELNLSDWAPQQVPL